MDKEENPIWAEEYAACITVATCSAIMAVLLIYFAVRLYKVAKWNSKIQMFVIVFLVLSLIFHIVMSAINAKIVKSKAVLQD